MGIRNTAAVLLFYLLVVCTVIAATMFGSIATATIAGMIPVEREHTIVIDPGHGGVDGGAVSCTGVPESQLNLEIGLRLNDLFHLLGYQTKMIRTTDISVYTEDGTIAQKKVSDLKERVRIVNETENAVLLSIHQNTFSDSRYSGAQVFYGPGDESRELASALQESFGRSLDPESNRKSKKSNGVYLMDRIECTGILVECGFLSNPAEEALLRSGEYQKKLSCVIAASVSNFLDKRTDV